MVTQTRSPASRPRRRVLIGTSGWIYRDWKGRFYPEKLPQREWFDFYARHFPTVEINATFYRLMPESTFRGWGQKAPRGFCFAVKMWRMVTHRKKLKDCEGMVAGFLDRARLIGGKLGPILVQLPPSLRPGVDLLDAFLAMLLAEAGKRFRHAPDFVVEFRHPAWFADETYKVLDRHGVGLCLFDHPEIECPRIATGDLVYVRFHGRGSLYAGKYRKRDLKPWADFLQENADQGRRIYAYFNNDFHAFAIQNARDLMGLLGIED